MTITETFSRAAGAEFKDAEKLFRTHLAPELPAILRLDGRAFHSYCRGLAKPYDEQFMSDMDQVALELARQIDGVRAVYAQSDEISLLLRPVDAPEHDQSFMFGGQIQKLVSISAAIASSTLNARRLGTVTDKVALFDSRAFTLAPSAVQRYFQWRQADARINSLSMLASTHFSHRQLHGVGDRERRVMLESIGVDPHALPAGFVNGRVVVRRPEPSSRTFFDKRVGEDRTVEFTRNVAYVIAAPDFEHDFDDAAY